MMVQALIALDRAAPRMSCVMSSRPAFVATWLPFAVMVMACGDRAPASPDAEPPRRLSFERRGPFPVGEHPNSLVVADLDGDHRPDVAAPGLFSDDLTLLWNAGGELAFVVRIPLPGGPLAAVSADFDEDGVPDLAVSLPTAGRVRLLRGEGGFGFRTGAEVAVDAPGAIAHGDLDGDGHEDLAVARYEDGRLLVLHGDGAAGLTRPREMDAAPGVSAVTVADVDGDGRMDVGLTATDDASLHLYLGSGAGRTSRVPAWPSALAAANLDEDPALELVGTAHLGNVVFVASLEGADAVAIAETSTSGPIAVAVGDLDADGRPDAVVTNKFANSVTVLLNNGAGRLVPQVELETGDGPTPIALADMDGDGRLDVIVADAFSDDVILFVQK